MTEPAIDPDAWAGDIIIRIEECLYRMKTEGMEARAIYLTRADRRALSRRDSKLFGGRVHSCSYEGIPLRSFDKPRGKQSAIYSKQGVQRLIKKSVPMNGCGLASCETCSGGRSG